MNWLEDAGLQRHTSFFQRSLVRPILQVSMGAPRRALERVRRLVRQVLGSLGLIKNQLPALPALPHHKPQGIQIEKGDRVTVTDAQIWLRGVEDLQAAARRRTHRMHIPEWAQDLKSGATFLLQHEVPAGSFNVDGAQVVTGASEGILDVAFPDLHGDLHREAVKLAYRVLDVLATDQLQASDLVDPLREYSTWVRAGGASTLSCVWTERLVSGMSVQLEVRSPDGQLRTEPPPTRKWHASFSYFRRSQTTDDLHESYRNLFLAFEALLSEAYPWTPGLGEARWLERALRRLVAGYGIDINAYLENPGGNPYRRFIKEQYRARRCALFHAKLSEGPIAPGDTVGRADLVAATTRLGQLYVNLARHLTGVRFAGGGMSQAAIEQGMRGMTPSDFFASLERGGDLANAYRFPCGLELSVGGNASLHCLRGSWNIPDGLSGEVLELGTVLSGAEGDERGFAAEVCIDLRSVQHLEAVLQVEWTNTGNLREWFF